MDDNIKIKILRTLSTEQINQLNKLLQEEVERDERYGVMPEKVQNYYDNFVEGIQKGTVVIVVAENSEKIIGSIIIRLNSAQFEKHSSFLMRLQVSPEFRGKGVAKKILSTTEQYLKENGIERMEITVRHDNPALQLYEKIGFKQFGTAQKATKYQGKYYDEVYLEKFI